MSEKIYKIFEVDDYLANKLLKTGNCVVLATGVVSNENEECPTETRFMYSIGQSKLEDCPICSSQRGEHETVEYSVSNNGIEASKVCRNGNYSRDIES